MLTPPPADTNHNPLVLLLLVVSAASFSAGTFVNDRSPKPAEDPAPVSEQASACSEQLIRMRTMLEMEGGEESAERITEKQMLVMLERCEPLVRKLLVK